MGNRIGFRGVPDLYADHYTVGIGKEKAPNFRVACYRNVIMGNHYDKFDSPWVRPEIWLRSSPNDKSQSNVHTLTPYCSRFSSMGDIKKPKIKITYCHISLLPQNFKFLCFSLCVFVSLWGCLFVFAQETTNTGIIIMNF